MSYLTAAHASCKSICGRLVLPDDLDSNSRPLFLRWAARGGLISPCDHTPLLFAAGSLRAYEPTGDERDVLVVGRDGEFPARLAVWEAREVTRLTSLFNFVVGVTDGYRQPVIVTFLHDAAALANFMEALELMEFAR